MNSFNFKSQICTDRNQSERLLVLGLKKETADMGLSKVNVFCQTFDFVSPYSWTEEQSVSDTWYPAWSLYCLWELLPKSIWHDNGLEKKYHPIIEYGFVNYVAECGMELFDFDCGYDVWSSMIVVIEWLINEGYFNKEYLV